MSGLHLDIEVFRAWLITPLPALALTFAAYAAGAWLYRRANNFPLLHPSLIGAIIIAIVLWSMGTHYREYIDGVQLLYLLMGTATVALAIPLYQHFALIRQLGMPILITVAVGATIGSLSAVGLAWWLGCSEEILRSLAAKSVTTPIALGITHEIGGIPELTNGAVLGTAVIGIVMAPLCFRLFNITDPRVRGMALGIAAHGMGASRAFEMNSITGAFASLSLCLTGIASAVAIPLVAHWLK